MSALYLTDSFAKRLSALSLPSIDKTCIEATINYNYNNYEFCLASSDSRRTSPPAFAPFHGIVADLLLIILV